MSNPRSWKRPVLSVWGCNLQSWLSSLLPSSLAKNPECSSWFHTFLLDLFVDRSLTRSAFLSLLRHSQESTQPSVKNTPVAIVWGQWAQCGSGPFFPRNMRSQWGPSETWLSHFHTLFTAHYYLSITGNCPSWWLMECFPGWVGSGLDYAEDFI